MDFYWVAIDLEYLCSDSDAVSSMIDGFASTNWMQKGLSNISTGPHGRSTDQLHICYAQNCVPKDAVEGLILTLPSKVPGARVVHVFSTDLVSRCRELWHRASSMYGTGTSGSLLVMHGVPSRLQVAGLQSRARSVENLSQDQDSTSAKVLVWNYEQL